MLYGEDIHEGYRWYEMLDPPVLSPSATDFPTLRIPSLLLIKIEKNVVNTILNVGLKVRNTG